MLFSAHFRSLSERNAPRPVATELWIGRCTRYCSRSCSGGGLIGAGGTAVNVLGVSVARDRLIIPSVAALSAPAQQVSKQQQDATVRQREAALPLLPSE